MTPATLGELCDVLKERPRPDLIRYKSEGAFRDVSTEEFTRRVRSLCRALMELGIVVGDRIALLSENRPEWPIADLAIQSAGGINVSIYPTLTPPQIAYILSDSVPAALIVSNQLQIGKVRASCAGSLPCKTILFDASFAPSGPGDVISLVEAYRLGDEADRRDPEAFQRRRASVRPDSIASIIYTSGTTGDPKGAMLTHSNFISNVEAILPLVPINSSDIVLSFLPLSHVFERTVEYCALRVGGAIAYAESLDTVAHDIREIRPTVVPTVPRLLEKVKARAFETAREGGFARRCIFHWALGRGRRSLGYTLAGKEPPAYLRWQRSLADRMVFSKLRQRLGGRLRFFVSGGAPLPLGVAEFFLSEGVVVLEGYGLTETSPVIAVNTPGGLRLGTVGRVVPGVEVRIAEDGEVLVRGPNVMKGYWNKPEATAEAMRDGWFHTGDIGSLDQEGFLKITDRKKDILVTSGGKKVAPQLIENALRASRYIANAVCLGDGRNYLVALVVPEFENVRLWAREKGVAAAQPAELVDSGEVKKLIEGEIERTTAPFARFEKIKRFALLPADFSIDAGEITPTLKVKRAVVSRKYSDLIESLYS